MLAARVAASELPPLRERLPLDPWVVEPAGEIGIYGGMLRVFHRDAQAVSLVPHGAELYAVVDSLPLVIDPQGAAVPAKALAGTPGEARVWLQGSLPEAYPGMGVCLPEQHQVI